ncbi:CubicO group peptidase, beta-lactamase class C family [Cyclobacterium lianum]|uniref:CubicO group peptidase, beta-lactamase class C family n=1 Tax=Cyclobacterium lianum TaxID=388280 RepID=A0A1M7N3D7_9BACT|nr:serine hydrolase domain-containing protein [Cyclobacterium lianum]SHM97882.1 CubicO group peptidase, beta-lactamase class C family [Cyclobacterium lianum]
MKFPALFFLVFSVVQLNAQTQFEDRIEALLVEVLPDATGPGLTVGVVKEGQMIYLGSRGNMNLEYKLPFNDSTMIELASVTKQFTAACIGVLVEQGKLSLNQDVRTVVPELPFYGDTIRIRHLLNHTSGIRNHNVLLDLKGFDYAHRGYTNEMIEELMFRQMGINNAPGEKMLYSNTNYVLLKLIVERVSGQSIHEFSERNLFSPMGMNNTFFIRDLEILIPNRAYSYYATDDGYRQPKSLTLCLGAGGMKSTISDLLSWSQILLDPAEDLSYLKAFLTDRDTLNNGQLLQYGRGMFNSSYRNLSTYHHSGRDLGIRTQFIVVPGQELAVVVFTNAESINAVNISYKILDLILPEAANAGTTRSTYTHSSEELHAFAGTYQELNSDLRMNIYVENDTLKTVSSMGSEASILIAAAPGRFSRADSPQVRYSFDQTAGIGDLQVDFGGAIFYFERIQLADAPDQQLEAYGGRYYSEELDVEYLIGVEDGQLFLKYPNNYLLLSEGEPGVFGANRRTRYSFRGTEESGIQSFEVAAEGTVKGIVFQKIE